MKPIPITIIFTLLFFSKTFACLNGDSKILKDETILYMDREGRVPRGHIFYKDDFENSIKQLDSLYRKTKDLDYLSDKGLLLILLERYKEAIMLYLEIEKKEPNRYSTASNIGTAYELIGQNENALRWIKKSVVIDPKSHYNSEWIHVKILEAKIKGEPFYNTNFLLNTEFGSDITPTSQLTKKQLQDLFQALFYQLNERISFVKPKEKIVAQLLFDLGNIEFLLGNYNSALTDYEQAKIYGYTGQLIEQYIKQTQIKQSKKKTSPTKASNIHSYLNYEILLLSGLLLFILAILIYIRKKKTMHNKH